MFRPHKKRKIKPYPTHITTNTIMKFGAVIGPPLKKILFCWERVFGNMSTGLWNTQKAHQYDNIHSEICCKS